MNGSLFLEKLVFVWGSTFKLVFVWGSLSNSRWRPGPGQRIPTKTKLDYP